MVERIAIDGLAPCPFRTHCVQDAGKRTRLAAPVMSLSGHGASVLAVDFAPNGKILLSSGKDRRIFLWKVEEECANVAALSGHNAAVTDARWARDGTTIVSCSADKTVSAWDSETGTVLRRMEGHKGVVNAVSPTRTGQPLLVTACDDGDARIWDTRKKRAALVLPHPSLWPVTACEFCLDGESVLTSCIDGTVRRWDLRRGKDGPPEENLELAGHSNIVTHIALDQTGSYAASNSMDGTVRLWDCRPFSTAAAAERCRAVLPGATHGSEQSLVACCWEPTGDRVAAGGANRCVTVWDARAGVQVLLLPGHKGTVQGVAWSPTEPILASCGNDGIVMLGEMPEAGTESGHGAVAPSAVAVSSSSSSSSSSAAAVAAF